MLHKIPHTVVFLVIILFIKTGCSPSTDTENAVHDPQVIKIHLQYGFLDELNTFDGTLTKDLMMDGSITVAFWLSKTE